MSLEANAKSLPIYVLCNPERFRGGSVQGLLARIDTSDHEVWMLSAPPEAQPLTVGRLLAAAWLNRHEPIIPVQLMPVRPPVVYLLPSGEMRYTRGKRFATWTLKEIDRIAGVYCSQHAVYIEALLSALRGERGTFAPVPDDFVLQDPSGLLRLGPPPPEVPVDVSQSERVRWHLEWDRVVVQDYARNRYLLHLSDEQLGIRIENIMSNVHLVDEFARIALDSANPENRYWFSLLQEVMTELQMRHGRSHKEWPPGLVRFERLPGSLRPAQLDRRLRLAASGYGKPILVKYTSRRNAESALKRGCIRLAPASSYSDPSLNPAIRDHELVAEVDFNPYFSGIGHDPSLDRMIFPSPRRIVHRESGTDYYVYCLAQGVSNRLLLDFEAEAVLVIREPDEFLRRLDTTASARLPGWRALSEQVEYFDPLQVTPSEVEIPKWKHFKYAYQKEFRVAWMPPSTQQTLAPIFVKLGSLEDIAELCDPVPSQEIAEAKGDNTIL